VGVGARFYFLSQPLIGDEINWARFYCARQDWFTDENAHPNLSGWPVIVSCAVFGVHVFAIRLPVLLLFLVNVILIYAICLRYFNKRVGIIATILMLISPWELMASLQAAQESVFLAFFYILCAWMILTYARNGKRRYVLLAGLFFGMGLMCKLSAFALGAFGCAALCLLPLILDIESVKRRPSNYVRRIFIDCSLFVIIGLLVISAYFSVIILHGNYPQDEFRRIRQTLFFSATDAIGVPFASFALMIIILTPLNISLLAADSISGFLTWRRQRRKTKLLTSPHERVHMRFARIVLILWVTVPLCIFLFLIRNNGFERYLPVIFPAIAILNADFLDRFWKEHSHVVHNRPKYSRSVSSQSLAWPLASAIIIFLALTCVSLVWSQNATPIRPYYSPLANMQGISSNGLLLFVSDLGPAYYVLIRIVVLCFILSAFLILLWFLSPKLILLALLLGAGVFYCVYFEEQQLIGVFGPNLYDSARFVDPYLQSVPGNATYIYIGNYFITAPMTQAELPVFGPFPATASLMNAEHAIVPYLRERLPYTITSKNMTFIKIDGLILFRDDSLFENVSVQIRQSPGIVVYEDLPPLLSDNPLIRFLKTKCTLLNPLSNQPIAIVARYDCTHPIP